jgi:hypothetical protein
MRMKRRNRERRREYNSWRENRQDRDMSESGNRVEKEGGEMVVQVQGGRNTSNLHFDCMMYASHHSV